jgi:hypothetical protein
MIISHLKAFFFKFHESIENNKKTTYFYEKRKNVDENLPLCNNVIFLYKFPFCEDFLCGFFRRNLLKNRFDGKYKFKEVFLAFPDLQ